MYHNVLLKMARKPLVHNSFSSFAGGALSGLGTTPYGQRMSHAILSELRQQLAVKDS